MPPGAHGERRGLSAGTREPGRARGSAAGCWGEEAGKPEQAQQRLPVCSRVAAEGDRGVRAGGDAYSASPSAEPDGFGSGAS